MSWNIAKPGDQINGPVSITGALTSSSTISGTQIISTVATGTAPLTVASTTNVTNLNADLLDGQQGSFYQSADNINAGTLVVGRGGTGASTFTAGRVLFGNGTSALNTSANLFWDNANNRLGIGTATPGSTLDINAGTNLNLAVGGLTLDNFTNDGVGITFSRTTDDGDLMALGVCDTNKLGLFSREGLIFATGGAALYGQTTERLRIDSSGNVGIGTTNPIIVAGTVVGISRDQNSATLLTVSNQANNASNSAGIDIESFGGGWRIAVPHSATYTNPLLFSMGGNERMRLTSDGNLGLGVTPSAWTGYKAFQTGRASFTNDGGPTTFLTHNWYWSGSANTFIANDYATRYLQTQGKHFWSTSTTSGTAGNPVTFTDSMVLDASGNLGLGVTPSAWAGSGNLQFAGTASISTTSNSLFVGSNFYYNGGFKYSSTGTATYYLSSDGAHKWFTAPSGTAGTAITFTQAMTLDASGNLGIGRTDPSGYGKLAVAGDIAPVSPDGVTQGIFRASNDGAIMVAGYNGTASNYIRFLAGGLSERLRIKSTGQVNFVGLASDPAGAAAGDVYYNTTTNKLKCYNGTTWNDLF